MPKARQTIKIKVHKGSEIPKLASQVSVKGNNASAKTVIKAKVHKKK